MGNQGMPLGQIGTLTLGSEGGVLQALADRAARADTRTRSLPKRDSRGKPSKTKKRTEKDKQRQTKTNSKKQTEPNANIQGDKLEKEKKTKRNKETIL